MRNTCAFLFAGLIAIGAVSAAEAHEWAEDLFSTSLKHNFGTVAGGAKAEHEFEFANCFEEDIRILDIKSTCQCTLVRSKDGKKVFASGEKGAVIAKVNSKRFRGKKGATVTVRFDVPSRPGIRPSEVRFHVRSEISDLKVENDCVWFGPIEQGSSYSQTVSISVPPSLQNTPMTASVESDQLKADVHRTAQSGKVELRVTVAETAKPGFFPERVTLRVGNQRFPLQVVGTIRPSLSVTPSRLSLLLSPGGKTTKNLVVRAAEPVQIKTIHCEDGRFKAKVDPAGPAKKIHIIPVTYQAGDSNGRFDSVIRVDFVGEPASRTIPAHVEVTEPGIKSLAGR